MADETEPGKSGFTIGELENKMRKYGLEICLSVIFILTAIFTLVWGGAMVVWSIILSMLLGIVGALLPKSVHKFTTHAMRFIYKEKVTSIIIAVVGALIGIFVPPIIFALVGLIAGKAFAIDAMSHSGE